MLISAHTYIYPVVECILVAEPEIFCWSAADVEHPYSARQDIRLTTPT